MNTKVHVRKARPSDADAIARIYIEAWQDTYPALLPSRLLLTMTQEGQTQRWRNAITIAARETVYVAESGNREVVAMASFGRSRDSGFGFDSEIYTLYVDPCFTGLGYGRAMLNGAFNALNNLKHESCLIWAHARNPARFFYEAMGGKLVAERTTNMMGIPVAEVAFGWRKLAQARLGKTTNLS
jgi:ribosomal protein S18 acetylase RimI-like enzyme